MGIKYFYNNHIIQIIPFNIFEHNKHSDKQICIYIHSHHYMLESITWRVVKAFIVAIYTTYLHTKSPCIICKGIWRCYSLIKKCNSTLEHSDLHVKILTNTYVKSNRVSAIPRLWTGLDRGLDSGLTTFLSVYALLVKVFSGLLLAGCTHYRYIYIYIRIYMENGKWKV